MTIGRTFIRNEKGILEKGTNLGTIVPLCCAKFSTDMFAGAKQYDL
jgi:hypothetical protein